MRVARRAVLWTEEKQPLKDEMYPCPGPLPSSPLNLHFPIKQYGKPQKTRERTYVRLRRDLKSLVLLKCQEVKIPLNCLVKI